MYRVKSDGIIRRNSIDLTHARSLIPAVIGMILKKLTGAKLLFDIRGFGTAEKVDTGRVKKGSFLLGALRKEYLIVCKQEEKEMSPQQLEIKKRGAHKIAPNKKQMEKNGGSSCF